jgi:hypothetical protein
MTGITDMHLLITDTLKISMGVDTKTSQYLVGPPFASSSATHLLRIELIRLLIVACGMLSHTSSKAVRSCWILAVTGTHCRTCQSKHAKCVACLLSMQAWKNWDIFSFQEWCTNPYNMRPCIIMLKHEVLAADEWHDNRPQDFIMVSLCI